MQESSQESEYAASNNQDTKDNKESMSESKNNAFHSVAQTPCFAETPYTTDQFKGYKIHPDPLTVPSMMQTGYSRASYDDPSN